jgi:hypothetical protein
VKTRLDGNNMPKPSTWLLSFKSNIYSQTGEDGIIQQIIKTLPHTDKWAVEFGAWDGWHLSNTRNLIEHHGYSAVLIEGDESRFNDLQMRCSNSRNVFTINQFVGFDADNSLDKILENTPIPIDFDFLSIDIDGNDYHAWQAISKYTPKVVCIEFNLTIPTEVHFVQRPDSTVNHGVSLLSLVELGKANGYELVSVLLFNAFFVRADYYPLFGIRDNSPQLLRSDLSAITYLFSGYDGTLFLHGSLTLPWHNITLDQSAIQPLPRFLRKHPPNYSKMDRVLFIIYTKGIKEAFKQFINNLRSKLP